MYLNPSGERQLWPTSSHRTDMYHKNPQLQQRSETYNFRYMYHIHIVKKEAWFASGSLLAHAYDASADIRVGVPVIFVA
jgi:hypothetical protein